tara:strand:+ start:129 stop:683 length:555 start_codon:yes stop_codon:yes gene_type:complete
MTSELRVDRIVPTSGIPTGGGGGIIQVKQTVVTSSSTGTAGTPASVMTCSITPTQITNKILILIDANVGSSNGYGTLAFLYRGTGGSGVQLYFGDEDNNRPRVTRVVTSYPNESTTYNAIPMQINYLDSPSTTSEVTYDLRLDSYQDQGWSFNRSWANQLDTSYSPPEYDGKAASSMILMEVTA